jgi:MFS family permease
MRTLSPLQQYAIITANNWAFTLTDGALRMLVVFHFFQLGYTTLQIAFLFIFYEFFGILTNLYGGWLGARFGLKLTLWIGTLMQIAALLLLVPVADTWPKALSVAWVMVAQAISGIAKDLEKMSAKSAIRVVVPETPDDQAKGEQQLFRWVAILTGAKNGLKGLGFFVGGLLLYAVGFNKAVIVMAVWLALAFLLTLLLPRDIGRMKSKPAFKALFSKSEGINVLSMARFFLFGARDVWFVVALPVFLQATLGWRFWEVGGFMGLWVIGYGIVQGTAPSLGADPAAGTQRRAVLGRPAHRHPRPDGDHPLARGGQPRPHGGGGPGCVRGGVRHEFLDPQLHDPGLHRGRGCEPECGLLLHGQRRRPPGGHPALRCPVPGGRDPGVPVGLGPDGGSGGPGEPAAAPAAPAVGPRHLDPA